MKIFVPKNKKKIKNKNFDISKIIKFEKKIFKIYNEGKIKYPIHLTKGNEGQLKEIFKYIGYKIFEIKGDFGKPPQKVSKKFNVENEETLMLWGHYLLKN